MDLSFEGYVRSHFKMPHERFMAFAPGGDYHEKAETLAYHNIDAMLILGYTAAHASSIGWYAATNTMHFAKLASPASLAVAGLSALVHLESVVQKEYLLDIATDTSSGGVSRVLDVNRTNVPIYYSSV